MNVYEADQVKVKIGQEMEIRFPYLNETVLGKVQYVVPEVSKDTRPIQIRATVPNVNGKLKSNILVRASLEIPPVPGYTVIPRAVDGRHERQRYAFIQNESTGSGTIEKFERRKLEIAEERDDRPGSPDVARSDLSGTSSVPNTIRRCPSPSAIVIRSGSALILSPELSPTDQQSIAVCDPGAPPQADPQRSTQPDPSIGPAPPIRSSTPRPQYTEMKAFLMKDSMHCTSDLDSGAHRSSTLRLTDRQIPALQDSDSETLSQSCHNFRFDRAHADSQWQRLVRRWGVERNDGLRWGVTHEFPCSFHVEDRDGPAAGHARSGS